MVAIPNITGIYTSFKIVKDVDTNKHVKLLQKIKNQQLEFLMSLMNYGMEELWQGRIY